MITVKVPGKLMILGEHAVVYGYPCIVSTIDKHIKIRARLLEGNIDKIMTPGVADHSFINSALSIIRKKFGNYKKVSLEIESEISGLGLGSSAAVTVGVVKTLSKLLGLNLSNEKIFSLAYESVKKIQKMASGFDIAACIYGETILFDGKSKKTKILTREKLPLMIIFSGRKANTSLMVKRVADFRRQNREKVEKIFQSMQKIVAAGAHAIKDKNWSKLGELMTANHRLLVELGVSDDKLNQLAEVAVKAGAYGAKLSGAGGGDCIIALVNQTVREKVKEAIKHSGGKIIETTIGSIKGIN